MNFWIIWTICGGLIGFGILRFCFWIDKATNFLHKNYDFWQWLEVGLVHAPTKADFIFISVCLLIGPIGWIFGLGWFVTYIINRI